MNDNKIKLETVKKTANDGTIEIICDVLLELITYIEPKEPLGFKDEKNA